MYAKKRSGKKIYEKNKRFKKPSVMMTRVNSRTRNAPRTGGFYINNLLYGKEIKTFDRTNVSTTTPGTYNVVKALVVPVEIVLNNIDQGAAVNNRIGNKIRVISLHLKATIELGGAAGTARDVRIIVIFDRQSNSLAPSFANIYSSQNAATNCMMDPSFFERYSTVIDKRITLVAGTDSDVGVIDEYRKLSNDSMYTSSGTAGYGNIASGSFTLFFVSNEAASGSNLIDCSYFSRLRYVDV